MFSFKSTTRVNLLISLVFLIFLSSIPAFAQDDQFIGLQKTEGIVSLEFKDVHGNPITDLELFAQHSREVFVIASYRGNNQGTLRIKYADMPDFVFPDPFDGVTGTDIEINHRLLISPGYVDGGQSTFTVGADVDFSEFGPWERIKIHAQSLAINVLLPEEEGCSESAPIAVPLPEYSGGPEMGDSIIVEYTPMCGALYHTGEYFDTTTGSRGTLAQDRSSKDFHYITFSELTDGHTYEFVIIAHFPNDQTTSSAIVSTTIDGSAPAIVLAPEVLALPGGHIEVTWNLVEDQGSGVNYYVLRRKMVIGSSYGEAVTLEVYGDFYDHPMTHTYFDMEDDLIDGEYYNYWVDVADNVGNVSNGELSETEMSDGVLPWVPFVEILNDTLVNGLPFIGDPQLDILAYSDGPGLEKTDIMFYEIVRETPNNFGNGDYPGTISFVSGARTYDFGGTAYSTSVVPVDGNLINVNNKAFYVRARAMDVVGNLSGWGYDSEAGENAFAMADLFAPSAINNLDGVPNVVDGKYVMDLSWNVPSENSGCGVESFLIYDRIVPLPRDESSLPQWNVLEVLDTSVLQMEDDYVSHVVPVNNFQTTPTETEYLVLAKDYLGHITEITDDVRRFAFKDRYSPILTVMCDLGCGDGCDSSLPVLGDQVHVSWAGYFPDGVENMEFTLTHLASNEVIPFIQNVAGQTDFLLPLAQDGFYNLTAKPQFTDQLWGRGASLPVVFSRDLTPPSAVTSLTVDGTDSAFLLNWDNSSDANTNVEYEVGFKTGDVSEFNFMAPGDSLNYTLAFPESFVTYESYDLSVRPTDCLDNSQLVGNTVVRDMCLRAPVINDCEILNNNETVDISWSRPMPNASSDWRNILTIQPPGDLDPVSVTLYHRVSYHFNPVDVGLPLGGYYSVTVREQTVDADLVDANGAQLETEESLVADFLLTGDAPLAIGNFESFFLAPEVVTDANGYSISMRWDFAAREQDVTVRVTHGGGDGQEPLVENVALMPGSNTYILDLETLKYSDGGNTYGPLIDHSYPVDFVVLDLLGNESAPFSAVIDISARHANTPVVGGYEEGFYSNSTLDLVMEHVGYTVPDPCANIQYQVQVSLSPDFVSSVTMETLWFTGATGEMFPTFPEESEDLFLRARARFSWDISDFASAKVTPWSQEFGIINGDTPGITWLRLDDVSPYPVNDSFRVTNSVASLGPASDMVDVAFSWIPVTDRSDSSEDGVGIMEYRIYRRAAGHPFNFDAPLAVITDSTAIDSGWEPSFIDNNCTMRASDESDPTHYDLRTDYYTVQSVDLLGNERTVGNDVIQIGDFIPSAPDQLTAFNSETLEWSWAPLEEGIQTIDYYVVERSVYRQSLGSPLLFQDGAGEATDYRLEVDGDCGNCATIANFESNSEFDENRIYFHVRAVGSDGRESPWSEVLEFDSPVGETKGNSMDQVGNGNLVNFVLDQNFPNPFNPQTTVRFHVPRSSHVNLRIYDVRGQLVRTLVEGTVESGTHSIQWFGNDQTGKAVSTGIYFYKLETPDDTLLRRMVLMR